MTVWKDLLLLCETALKGYPNSIEEDEQLLSETNISENIRNIIILRHGEKAIFRKYV